MTQSVKEQWALRQAALSAFAAAFGIRADGEDPVVAAYIGRQEELIATSQAIINSADGEKRELSAEEKRQIADNTAEVERLDNEITLRQRVAAQHERLEAPRPRVSPPNAAEPPSADELDPPARPQASRIQTVGLQQPLQRSVARGNGGWRNLGDFAQAVRGAVSSGRIDPRLAAAATTYGAEGVGADGGFAVPPDFRSAIMTIVTGENSLMSRCDAGPTESNSVTVPVDETTAWGTSGVRVYTRAEAAAMTASKPALKEISVRLHELYAFVPVTDELLEDAPMLARMLTTKAGDAINFALNNYIVNGTGAGQPLGIMNSPCLVTLTKESSQTATTIHAKNVAKMWARMPAAARSQAVWLANQDVEAQLMELGFQVGSPASSMTGGMPLFVPPGGLSALPYATLLGRPIITTEACATLGTTGDLIFAYLPGYFMPYKAGGIRSDVSIHLYFDQAITSFRWTMRVGGQPWLSTTIARKNGSNVLSHFVCIETRS